MYDLVLRGGTVIDGSGGPRRIADVAVTDGIVVAVDKNVGEGKREIACGGSLVTPGFVDIHTHYDGQATWDPYLTPSSWHGVTTAVFGNCSVGFAPVRPGAEKYLINLMEGVEDIPEAVLAEGLDFQWESFPDYLDILEKTPRIMDIGAQVPHGPLRFYVMGDRGADHTAVPHESEIEEMGRLLEESLHAGALGFTTSRTTKHRAADGRLTPGLTATDPELAGLAKAMKRAGRGVIEVNSDFGEGDFARLRAAAEIAGRPLSVLLVQVDNAPNLWRETLDAVGDACRDGLNVTAQVGCRPIGMVMGLETSIHPFVTHPDWQALQHLTPAERYRTLRDNEDLRRRFVEALPEDGQRKWMESALKRTFHLRAPLDYEPDLSDSIASRAAAAGENPFARALDIMLGDNGQGLMLHAFENYCGGNLDVVHEMLTDPNAVCGVADAGAHVGIICDASSPTYLLTHWGRDRTRGPKLDLEFLVHKQSRQTALVYGLADRGLLQPGYKADINVIDYDNLRLTPPELRYDLPAGGRRLVQQAHGYRHTFVSGVEVMTGGEPTGALPGNLVRGAQPSP